MTTRTGDTGHLSYCERNTDRIAAIYQDKTGAHRVLCAGCGQIASKNVNTWLAANIPSYGIFWMKPCVTLEELTELGWDRSMRHDDHTISAETETGFQLVINDEGIELYWVEEDIELHLGFDEWEHAMTPEKAEAFLVSECSTPIEGMTPATGFQCCVDELDPTDV